MFEHSFMPGTRVSTIVSCIQYMTYRRNREKHTTSTPRLRRVKETTVSPQLAYWQTGRTPLPLKRDSAPSKDTLDEKTRSQRHYVDFVIVNSQNSQASHPHYHRYSSTADSNIEPCPTRCWWNVSRETFHQHHPVPGIINSMGEMCNQRHPQ